MGSQSRRVIACILYDRIALVPAIEECYPCQAKPSLSHKPASQHQPAGAQQLSSTATKPTPERKPQLLITPCKTPAILIPISTDPSLSHPPNSPNPPLSTGPTLQTLSPLPHRHNRTPLTHRPPAPSAPELLPVRIEVHAAHTHVRGFGVGQQGRVAVLACGVVRERWL